VERRVKVCLRGVEGIGCSEWVSDEEEEGEYDELAGGTAWYYEYDFNVYSLLHSSLYLDSTV